MKRQVLLIAAVFLSFIAGVCASISREPSEILWSFSLVSSLSALGLFSLVCFISRKEEELPDHGSARWADKKDIKKANLLDGKGIIVGALRGMFSAKLLRYHGEGHIILASPTRSGKGVSIILPNALTWAGSVIFNDIKGELWALSSGWRSKELGSVCLKFDATCKDGSSARWNPLYEIREYPQDVRDAQNIALILSSSESTFGRSDSERHWRTMGARLIKAAILHQLYAGQDKSLPGCYKLLTSSADKTLKSILKTKHDPKLEFAWLDSETGKPTPTHPAVAEVVRDMLGKSERELSAIISSAVSYLEPFDDPIMAANVSESDFSLKDLMQHEKPVSLYLTTPVSDLERVSALHRLFFTLAGTRNTEQLEFESGAPKFGYKHKLLMVFDEFVQLGYSPEIQKHFSLASGYGIQGLFVFQDFSQLFELYGRHESITSNCDVKIAFAPNSIDTAEYLSRILGSETRDKKNSSLARSLLTPDECQRISSDKSLILKNGCFPILGDRLPYYEVPELMRRSKIQPAKSEKISRGAPFWFEGRIFRATKRKHRVQKNIEQINLFEGALCKKKI